MGWPLHVAKQAITCRLPYAEALRQLKRRAFGYEPDPSNLLQTLSHYTDMRQAWERAGLSATGATVLEVGTGWFPTVPLCLLADGARRVLMTDLNVHLDNTTYAATRRFLTQREPARFAGLAAGSWQELPLEYLAPFNPDHVADASLDFVVSRTVLEHIPAPAIVELLSRLRPKLRAGGAMVHCIDHSDHLEHRDKRISKVNFLTWPDQQHRLVNWLTREGENRLRHHEYPELFRSAGFDVISSQANVHQPTAEKISALALKDRFKTMSAEQLATLDSTFVIVPRRSDGAPVQASIVQALPVHVSTA